MLKFLADIVQIAIVLKIVYSGAKWIFFRKKKSRKGVLSKVWMLVSRNIHHSLNRKLTQQTEAFRLEKAERTSKDGKVVPLRRKTN